MNRSQGEAGTALLTGAASGLGRALAVALAQRGWQIALTDVNDAGARETLALVEAAGGTGRVEHLDVTQADQWDALCRRLQNDWPALDLLINNAGVACGGELGAVPLEDWRWTLETNLFGTILGCHTCIAWLKQNPLGAHIVNVASVAAVLAGPTMAPYNVSKAGVLAFSETLHAELRSRGVGVTVVCPGFFASDLLRTARIQTDHQRKAAQDFVCAARIQPADVAQAVLRAVARRRLYVILPARARLLWHFKRLLPRTWLRLAGWAYQRQLNQSQQEAPP